MRGIGDAVPILFIRALYFQFVTSSRVQSEGVNNSPAGCRQALKHWLHLSQFICNVAVWVTCTNLSSIRYPQWMLLMQFCTMPSRSLLLCHTILKTLYLTTQTCICKIRQNIQNKQHDILWSASPLFAGAPVRSNMLNMLESASAEFLSYRVAPDRQYATRTAASPHRGRSREWQGPWVAWSPKYSAANYGISFQITQQTDRRLLRCKKWMGLLPCRLDALFGHNLCPFQLSAGRQ